ncbi:hypothetical protein J6590_023169 [Homalodisca vitripennis]|nr:hypothetical protein J6590_023169 [Homalodisca vitripennis]
MVGVITESFMTSKPKFAGIRKIRDLYKLIPPEWNVHIFGSQATGLACASSDVDLFIDQNKNYCKGLKRSEKDDNLRNLLYLFLTKNGINGCTFELRDAVCEARVPILRVIHVPTNTKIDIASSNGLAVENSKLVRYPKLKKQKEQAYSKMIMEYGKEYGKVFGKEITIKKLQKKIYNLKGDLKKKNDRNATSNKKIVLKDWEKKLLMLFEVDKNPTFTTVPGAQSAGTRNDNAQSSSASASATCVEQLSTPCGSTSGKRQKVQLQLNETEETKNLENADLQQLVLLEQLQLIRMQKEKER